MKIAFEFQDGPSGGGNQFLLGLRTYIQEKKISSESIMLNANPMSAGLFLEIARQVMGTPEVTVIVRMDGPVYLIRQSNAWLDRFFLTFCRHFADGVIFQSNWSEAKNLQLLEPEVISDTILNCARPEFQKLPQSRQDGTFKLIITSWSSNWQKGFEFYKFLDEALPSLDITADFYGNSPVDFKNIKAKPPLAAEDLNSALNNADAYLTASANDPCSNALIEALAAGLPAIALSDGGHPEILGQHGELFSDANQMITAIEKLRDNHASYAPPTRKDASVTYEKYVAFDTLVQASPNARKSNRLLAMWGYLKMIYLYVGYRLIYKFVDQKG